MPRMESIWMMAKIAPFLRGKPHVLPVRVTPRKFCPCHWSVSRRPSLFRLISYAQIVSLCARSTGYASSVACNLFFVSSLYKNPFIRPRTATSCLIPIQTLFTYPLARWPIFLLYLQIIDCAYLISKCLISKFVALQLHDILFHRERIPTTQISMPPRRKVKEDYRYFRAANMQFLFNGPYF